MIGQRGTYKYKVWHKGAYEGNEFRPAYFTRHSMRVEVVKVLNKQYRVKFLGYHEDGRGPGTITAVQKTSVIIDANESNTTPNPGIVREIKLPYKDD